MFYCYSQNNSGGSFMVDDRVCHHVIVEAGNSAQADEIAEAVGIYFNGCDDGVDCDCCGDRWYSAYGDGDAEPEIYGSHPREYQSMFVEPGEVYCRIYYKDGFVAEFRHEAQPSAPRIEA